MSVNFPAVRSRTSSSRKYAELRRKKSLTFVAQYEKDIDAVRLFEKKSNGMLERINPFGSFWFSWVALSIPTQNC